MIHHKLDQRHVALRFIALQDIYQPRIEAFMGEWNEGTFLEMAIVFDDMRLAIDALGECRVQWVEVLLTRYEVYETMRQLSMSSNCVRLQEQLGKHLNALRSLRRKCESTYCAGTGTPWDSRFI